MDFSFEMFRDIPSVVSHHAKAGTANYSMVFYITLVHVLALVGAFTVPQCSLETLLWAFILWPISGFGITVGAHRLWSHRSFEACFAVRVLFMLLNCLACQGTIWHWARDHRVHHKFSETAADPHDATRGFFFAHIGWLFVKKNPDMIKAGRQLDYSDLESDPVVMFQKKLDMPFQLFICYIMPALVAQFFWHEHFWNAFFVPGALRYCIVLHCTWFVNSAAHFYGDHPYDGNSYPAENPFVSFCAIGEGWHNWHHKYPYDYAASEYGISSQFNPSKLLIDILAAFGLVWGRKRATSVWSLRKIRLHRDVTNGINLPKVPPNPREGLKRVKPH